MSDSNERAKALLWRLGEYAPLRRLYYRWEHRRWQARGCIGNPPARFKQQVVKEYATAYSLQTLVETGTLLGDMIFAHRRNFDRIFSIELDRDLYDKACRRFRRHSHIQLIPGDSAQMLAFVLPKVADRSCLFWLDAHWMEGGVRAENITPILQELTLILESEIQDFGILIDDARLFRAGTGYPPLEQIRELVASRRPQASFFVQSDIIRILPFKDT